jgi:DNA-binding transcriptional LysR family regulator
MVISYADQVDGAFRDLDVRQLAALCAVADERSFAKAAARLGFTQSAVSQQIAALERQVDMKLFDRPAGPRPAELTPAGELLLAHARTVLAQLAAASDDLDRLRRGEAGRLVVGTFQSTSNKLLPAIVGRLRAERPALEVRLFETDDDAELVAGLVTGELDLSFVIEQTHDERLELVELVRDRYIVMTRAEDATPGARVDAASLHGAPVVGSPEENVCNQIIDRGLGALGVEPTYVFRSVDNGAIQGMVRAGLGRSVMPYLAIDPDDPGVVVQELDPPIPPRRIAIARRAGRTLAPAAERFIELAIEVTAELTTDVLRPVSPHMR